MLAKKSGSNVRMCSVLIIIVILGCRSVVSSAARLRHRCASAATVKGQLAFEYGARAELEVPVAQLPAVIVLGSAGNNAMAGTRAVGDSPHT